MDDDGGHGNDNDGVDDDGGVDINDGNDVDGADSINRTDHDDADGSGDNIGDRVDGNGVFGKWCTDWESGDEGDSGDEQTEQNDLSKCNGSSKMKIRVEWK